MTESIKSQQNLCHRQVDTVDYPVLFDDANPLPESKKNKNAWDWINKNVTLGSQTFFIIIQVNFLPV
jgi:hypothetical protein